MVKIGLTISSTAAIVGGIVLYATGVGIIAEGLLLGAGAGSLINGYVNEANNASFIGGCFGDDIVIYYRSLGICSFIRF